MNGKMTTSRMGIIGRRLVSDFSFEVSMFCPLYGCNYYAFSLYGPAVGNAMLNVMIRSCSFG